MKYKLSLATLIFSVFFSHNLVCMEEERSQEYRELLKEFDGFDYESTDEDVFEAYRNNCMGDLAWLIERDEGKIDSNKLMRQFKIITEIEAEKTPSEGEEITRDQIIEVYTLGCQKIGELARHGFGKNLLFVAAKGTAKFCAVLILGTMLVLDGVFLALAGTVTTIGLTMYLCDPDVHIVSRCDEQMFDGQIRPFGEGTLASW